MLANELDEYRGQENKYVNDNIQEIQELYRDERQRKELKEGRVEDKEVILIKLYKESTTTSKTTESSFIHEEIKNLEQYMKFVHSLTQTRLFKLPPHYQALQSREEQDPEFWKEIAVAFMNDKYNTETLQNEYLISIYQGGPLHKLYFIAIDNQG